MMGAEPRRRCVLMGVDRHVTDMLPGLALGSLEPQEARRVRAHLAVCAACQEELASMDDVVGRMAMALPAAAPPPGLQERIMERVRRTGNRTRSPLAFLR